MIKRYFKCKFLTDIILNESAATQGHIKSLDYIPGSNFLGIVANQYNKFQAEGLAYKIFHSGEVHFSDGHLMINAKRSHKMPFYWFHKKTDTNSEKIYVHHKVSNEMHKQFTKKGIQLKQVRSGFFAEDKQKLFTTEISHSYSLKSAYDSKKRRAKDEALYGYDSLSKGTSWVFYIEAEADILDKIEKELVGEKSIGRSRTAQYGRVEIEKYQPENHETVVKKNVSLYQKEEKIMLIYFDANASFLDEYQQPTFQPTEQQLKLNSDCKIKWDLSQIRTKMYSPWNGKRRNRDFARVCLEKGSVLAIKIPEDFDVDAYQTKIQDGLGLFKNEGFGQVLVNPPFLTEVDDRAELLFNIVDLSDKNKNKSNPIQHIISKGDNDEKILSILESIQKQKDYQMKVLEAINKFVHEKAGKFQHISSSQWGQIRTLAMRAKSKEELGNLLFEEKKEEGYLMHGKAEENWRRCRDDLKIVIKKIYKDTHKQDEYVLQFVINLCAEMAKKARKRGK